MTAEMKDKNLSDATRIADRSTARKPGILIADDLSLILTLLKFELEPRGFNVWLAVDGNDAVDLYRRHGEEIDLVLLDVEMPGLDGPQTLVQLQRLNPNVVACFMTANAENDIREDLLVLGAAWIFNKPFGLAKIGYRLQMLASAHNRDLFVSDWQCQVETSASRMRLSLRDDDESKKDQAANQFIDELDSKPSPTHPRGNLGQSERLALDRNLSHALQEFDDGE